MSYLRIKKAVLLLGNECEIIEDRAENREKDEHIVSNIRMNISKFLPKVNRDTRQQTVIIVQCNNR